MNDHHGNFWKITCIVLAVFVSMTAMVLFTSFPHHYDNPVHLTVSNPSIREVEPAEGQDADGWVRYFQVEMDLQNDGGQPVSLSSYHLEFEPKDEGWVEEFPSDRFTVTCEEVLPCSAKIHLVRRIQVDTRKPDGEIFPLELRYHEYEFDITLAVFDEP